MRLMKPLQLRKDADFACTAMRNAITWDEYDLPDCLRRKELKRRLFKVNYRRADKRNYWRKTK